MVRLAVFAVALLFMAALWVLTVQDIQANGATPVDIVAVVLLVVFTIGVVGAMLHPPRR